MRYVKTMFHRYVFILTAVLTVLIDQASKLCIRLCLIPGQSVPSEGVFRITYSTNEGGVFGLPLHQAVLITLSVLVIVSITFLYMRYPIAHHKLLTISLGMIMGGAIGNLIDRVFVGEFGRVVDFIDIGAWPVFNLADSAIVIGTAMTAYYFIFLYKKDKPQKTPDGKTL